MTNAEWISLRLESTISTINSGLYAVTFFPHFQPCGLYSDMIYVVILYFYLKLPGNVLGAAYNQVCLIVRNLWYVKGKLEIRSQFDRN